jgi:hypothetical protein
MYRAVSGQQEAERGDKKRLFPVYQGIARSGLVAQKMLMTEAPEVLTADIRGGRIGY